MAIYSDHLAGIQSPNECQRMKCQRMKQNEMHLELIMGAGYYDCTHYEKGRVATSEVGTSMFEFGEVSHVLISDYGLATHRA